MADLSAITLPNGSTYNIKDATARASKTITLTGDVTGSVSSTGNWNIATSLSSSGVTTGSYGPSANVTLSSGSGSFSVPYFTVDSKGRVTAASTKTITIVLPIYNGSVT